MSKRQGPALAAPADRFAAALTALGGGTGPMALAVSGGGDSLALLRLAAMAFPGQLYALSVDHGLRAAAAGECALAGRIAASLGVPHHILTLAALPDGPGMQARARAGRYAAMAGWCREQQVPHLLTAHHRDDQAETLLMRLRRGSGVAGLAGVRAVVRIGGVTVLRPLLHWPRADLRALVADWEVAQDPSNSDPRFDRTGARALLAREPWLEPKALAAAAGHLADAEDALDWAARRAFASRVERRDALLVLDVEALPFELQRRMLALAIAELGGDAEGGDVARLAKYLVAGSAGTVANVMAGARGTRWEVRTAPPRR